MPVSTSDEDIGGVPSMQSSYSAEMKRYGICMEERRVHCKAQVKIQGDFMQVIDNYGGKDFWLWWKRVLIQKSL